MSQVATRAKVSRATVSHVLSGSADRFRISSKTQKLVFDVAEELGYRRNLIARAMVTGKSRIIGVLTYFELEGNIVQILAGAMEAANDNDYVLKMIYVPYDVKNGVAVTQCLEWHIDGVMIVGLSDEAQHQLQQEFDRVHLPLALIDVGSISKWGVRFVSDDVQGIGLAVSHLVGLGHRRIAFLGGSESELSAFREIIFRSIVAEAGLALLDSWIRNTCWIKYDLIAEGVRSILSENRPTSIVCSSDIIAMVAMREASLLGLRVPEDLSVIGYDNVNYGAYTNPPLTSVDQPFQEMGHAAVMYLIQRAEDETANTSFEPRSEVLLPTRLVERASTAPPPQ